MVINIQNSSHLNYFMTFTLMCILEVIFIHCICKVEMLIMVCYCVSLPDSLFTDIALVVYNWPRWEYLQHGNWQTLQSRT